MDEHRKNCEREGRVEEANQTRRRLKKLRIQEEESRKAGIIENHKNELVALENAHRAELKELQNKWNNIVLPNFENETALLEMELKKRHENELDQFRISID